MKISKEKVFSIMESLLFANPEPTPVSTFYTALEEHCSHKEVLSLLEEFEKIFQNEDRGLCLKKINKGYQLRTKPENKEYLLKMVTQKSFRLSGPSLEVLSAIAYNQPCPKQDIDQIRGVESGHLIRTLMEKNLVIFAGKSDLPGKPSLYKTTDKFLEIFGFNSLSDLPSEDEINELLPQAETEEKEELHHITDTLSEKNLAIPYQQDEEENENLKETLKSIPTTVDFLKEQKKVAKEVTLEQSKSEEPASEEEPSPATEQDSPS